MIPAVGNAADPLDRLILRTDIGEISPESLISLVNAEEGIRRYAPGGRWAEDPRTAEMTLFNPARAGRPVDYDSAASPKKPAAVSPDDCPVCSGRTTGILDIRDLSAGRTFINMNLYPMLLPRPSDPTSDEPAAGIHLPRAFHTLPSHT